LGVDTVLVVQVNVVGAEPPQRTLDRGADVGRAAVEDTGAAAGVGDHAELGRHHDLVAAAVDGAAEEFLVGERPVDLGGVQQGDAQLERSVDGADGLGVVAAGAGVGGRHPHGAQADAGDVQLPQLDVLHGRYVPFEGGGWLGHLRRPAVPVRRFFLVIQAAAEVERG
jgi:hypothetical protein